jgi:phytoene desaturase
VSKKVIVIGSGFAGLSAACTLAQKGYSVTLLEKNESAGGRASKFEQQGFMFDMGPSWYWMPDVFEKFFNRFGKTTAHFYNLQLLDPGYRIFWGANDFTDIPADYDKLKLLFESWEKGSARNLDRFMDEAAYKYEVGINELVYKPSRSVLEFADLRLLKGLLKMQLFTSLSSHVNKLFRHDRIKKILEFPVYFLGALPQNTPALYSMMNYADLKLKTWYPMGGMHEIVKAMVEIAEQQGVKILYNRNVQRIEVTGKDAKRVVTDTDSFDADIVVAGADYNHIEQKVLQKPHRQYDEKYWDKRVMAPSSLIYYLGVNKKIKNLLHHNLFFDESFETFAQEIYVNPKWPTKPLFYVCAASKTDPTVAPEGHENVFILIPVAPGLKDTEATREKYYDMVMKRLEALTGETIKEHVVYKRSFAHNDFQQRYNAFKGNAYGLANTLLQTAIFKPSLKSPKIKNLYYTGQLTVPGPGVPPSIISGQVVADEIEKEYPT